MACTPEQIEAKRKQAQLKLAQKMNNIIKSPIKTIPSCDMKSSVTTNSGWDAASISSHQMYHRASNNENFRSTTSKPKPYDKPKETTQLRGKDIVKLSCSLISDERFSVEMSTFSTTAINVFKTIPTRSYDPKTRIWNFHIKDYDRLILQLNALKPNVVVDTLPNYVVNLLKQQKRDYTNVDISKIDPVLGSSLMQFQQEGVCFGIDKKGRCLIADDMGLGKTFQALGIASYYREDWPMLIVTTASMKNVWEDTVHNYLPSVSVLKTQYMVSAKDYIEDALILIVSHDMMSRAVDKLLEKKFGVLIIDESHTFKNFKAKCTQAATKLARKAKRVVLLSGTPALSRPSELYTQLALIDERFFGSFFEYSKRYCDGRSTNFGWDATGKSNLQELEIILARKFMIRRTKDEVLKAMPNKTQEVVTLDVKLEQFSDSERRCLNALANKYNSGIKGTEKHAALLTFFAETAKIKIPSVCSYVLQILAKANKFLIFAHHQVMLDAIEQLLRRKDVKFIRIDGSTGSDQRKYFVDKFQENDSYKCAVLSITAANAGITLTAAQLVLFAELHWNPSILSQAESRAHRIGQTSPVVVRYLLAPGTADDSMWPMLQEKQKILGEVGLLKDSFNNVVVKRQDKTDESVTEGLDFSRVTSANTLDITTYFKDLNNSSVDVSVCDNSMNVSKMDTSAEDMDVFDDGFDDVLSNIDV